MSQVHVYFLPSLNGTAVTDLILIHFTQRTQTSTFTKPSALHSVIESTRHKVYNNDEWSDECGSNIGGLLHILCTFPIYVHAM